MISLRFSEDAAPRYMTPHSAGADLLAQEDVLVAASCVARVPTGVWIEQVDWTKVAPGSIPELQIRARSGLAFKHGIMLANGVGTVDADYPDEIGVLLFNSRDLPYQVRRGDRIAQLVLCLAHRIPQLAIGPVARHGGFGSTDQAVPPSL